MAPSMETILRPVWLGGTREKKIFNVEHATLTLPKVHGSDCIRLTYRR